MVNSVNQVTPQSVDFKYKRAQNGKIFGAGLGAAAGTAAAALGYYIDNGFRDNFIKEIEECANIFEKESLQGTKLLKSKSTKYFALAIAAITALGIAIGSIFDAASNKKTEKKNREAMIEIAKYQAMA